MIERNTRQLWVDTAVQLVAPVFGALAEGHLRQRMPVEVRPGAAGRERYAHLEAVGRSLAGIGPWLELAGGTGPEEEGRRIRLLDTVRRSLVQSVDPHSPDRLNFREGAQPLVDAAFLALGLLRSWRSVWLELPPPTQAALVDAFIATRAIRPYFNNWLLFSAVVEAFLAQAQQPWDRMRVDYAVRQHEQWYKGDGTYGDGPEFHWDYYNSYVIHPMLCELVQRGGEVGDMLAEWRERVESRAQRYGAILEGLIAPDGTFPPLGRSLSYRLGAFHLLAHLALQRKLPPGLAPAAVRCALTAALRCTLQAPGTLDREGWLQIGLCGHQPELGESYISTGSLYLTLCGFLPLGLPVTDSFWAEPDAPWTAQRVWARSAR